MKLELYTIMIIIALGSGFDSLTTYILARIAEGEEQNPILKKLINKLGLKALILWIPLEITLVAVFTFLSLKITGLPSLWLLLMLIPWIAASLNLAQIVLIITRRHR